MFFSLKRGLGRDSPSPENVGISCLETVRSAAFRCDAVKFMSLNGLAKTRFVSANCIVRMTAAILSPLSCDAINVEMSGSVHFPVRLVRSQRDKWLYVLQTAKV